MSKILESSWSAMTVREYAAIHLGVPDSGDAELDAMIRKANRMEFAKSAMRGQLASVHLANVETPRIVQWSLADADALLAALEAKP